MLRRLAVLFALVMVAVLVAAPAAMAKKPIAGVMDLDFQGGAPIWAGTIEIDGFGTYDMEFYNTGTGKRFDNRENNESHFFEETWVIMQTGGGSVVLSGYDRGVVSWANGKYRMNGYVAVAEVPFEGLVGRRVHMQGVINFDGGVPDTAPGIFRIGG